MGYCVLRHVVKRELNLTLFTTYHLHMVKTC